MAELDRLLADWGRSRRLPESAAERMLTAITTPAAGGQVLPGRTPTERGSSWQVLSADWWRTLNRRTNLLATGVLAGRAA